MLALIAAARAHRAAGGARGARASSCARFVVDARKEIDRRLKDEVRKAFVPAFAEHAQALLENYLTNSRRTARDETEDPITGEEDRDPDEKLMRAIEEKVKPGVPSRPRTRSARAC